MLALIRGDDRLSETKLYDALAGDRGPATTRRSAPPSAPAAARSARSASTGAIVADETLRGGPVRRRRQRDGWHLRGVEAGRDYKPAFADLREPQRGRSLLPNAAAGSRSRPRSRSATSSTSGRSTRSRSRRRSSTRTATRQPLLGGSYGIGPGRVMAAIVEQHHDEHGIVWPRVGRAVRRPHRRAAGARGAGCRARAAARRRRAAPCSRRSRRCARARSSPMPT